VGEGLSVDDYRRLRRTELRVSAIGVGGPHLRKDDVDGRRVFRDTAPERDAIITRDRELLDEIAATMPTY